MSNKQETKEQEVVIIEGNDTTVTEEKVGFIKRNYAKAKQGFHNNKKTIFSVAAGVGVGLVVGLLGSDFGKKNGLQKEGQQDYIEFEEVEEIESADEFSEEPEELEQLEGTEEN